MDLKKWPIGPRSVRNNECQVVGQWFFGNIFRLSKPIGPTDIILFLRAPTNKDIYFQKELEICLCYKDVTYIVWKVDPKLWGENVTTGGVISKYLDEVLSFLYNFFCQFCCNALQTVPHRANAKRCHISFCYIQYCSASEHKDPSKKFIAFARYEIALDPNKVCK